MEPLPTGAWPMLLLLLRGAWSMMELLLRGAWINTSRRMQSKSSRTKFEVGSGRGRSRLERAKRRLCLLKNNQKTLQPNLRRFSNSLRPSQPSQSR
ncbi:hypothetical protein NA56DRAFT_644847 [Hyaloscypha hepaticicola]|uniref:Uncharacterized protein n=1 Tax=Hyaloscypha hepaticicola TaxID=2082293 RepID=A0A2J6Q8R7_9HELO|nr:hypothetical protein NA56DRAFT_644847 [Hyaloscypha hepaticicola]